MSLAARKKLSSIASLLASVKRFAKDIKSKYLAPPATTNFGIMFLPTEGLYSEVVRNPAFFDSLRREEQIVVAGPSTLLPCSIHCLSALKRSIFKKVRRTTSARFWVLSNPNLTSSVVF